MDYINENGQNYNLVDNLKDNHFDVIILNFPIYKINTVDMEVYDYDDYYDYANGTHGDATTVSVDIYRDGGADYIERNAKVLEALLDEINNSMLQNHINNTIKIGGPSMGALIVQYALRDMELNNRNHNVDLFVSFDGPHKGANVPIGVQKALEYFEIYDVLTFFDTPSAKQMLINHYLAHSEGLPQGAPYFRDRFQNTLDQMGLPQQCTNVAILNGSIIGEEKAIAGDNFIFGYLAAVLHGFLQRYLWVNYTKNSGRQLVFRYLKKNWWGCNTQADIRKYSITATAYGSLDNAPGGYFNIKRRIEDELGSQFPLYNINGLSNISYHDYFTIGSSFGKTWIEVILFLLATTSYVDMTDDFSFVPAKSALYYSGTNTLWRECMGSRDLVCTGETPFDSYYAPRHNQEHASLHNEGVQWLLSAIQAVDNHTALPAPSVYNDCSTNVDLVLDGPDKLCADETATYYNRYNCSGNTAVNWTTSNNLQIISSSNSEITVKATTNGNKWIRADYDGTTYTKKIVGKPSFTLRVDNSVYPPEVEIIGDWIDIDKQGITSVTWTQTGGDGGGQLQAFDNEYYAYATGQGDDWYVTGQVEVTNSCGTTTRIFSLAPFLSFNPCGDGNPDNDYFIQKIGPNKYRVINPCRNFTINISASELYDIYGVKTNDITPVQDKVDFDNQVNPGEIKIMKVQVDGKQLSKRIITD